MGEAVTVAHNISETSHWSTVADVFFEALYYTLHGHVHHMVFM